MKTLPMIRLATYGVFVALMFLIPSRMGVIPVHLANPDLSDLAAEAEAKLQRRLDELSKILNSPGFLNSKRSGAELMQIAATAANRHGINLNDFRPPHVATTIVGERLQWKFTFTRDYGEFVFVSPETTYAIVIDDESGVATVTNESARM